MSLLMCIQIDIFGCRNVVKRRIKSCDITSLLGHTRMHSQDMDANRTYRSRGTAGFGALTTPIPEDNSCGDFGRLIDHGFSQDQSGMYR